MSNTLKIWQRMQSQPGGKWLFSRLVTFKAPYFRSIRPQFDELEPNRCRIHIPKRRAVQNHLGTVHAIAMCNMAELAGGTMTEVSVPATHRWIPKGMEVAYLKKAETDLVAVASPAAGTDWTQTGEHQVHVEVRDTREQLVFRATIAMWVSPKKPRA
ncbi:hotdog fold domain-containing protein [Curvibacter sp. APW13]|uniref:hotdog fold domain-containing protein n=1 Tax=Curvibacter sp. APW13 TaxID=3077236 RepID=UPI0028DECD0D|nr:hotdog fold domain-containing protein [Curvibacter sp. APW13]MDT8991994.1 hotdog fold domain-containing protein [Curvibacter sp. APW13]